MRFVGGNFGPCLYVKNNAKSVVNVALYVGDNLMVRYVEAIHDVTAAFKENRLVLKIFEGLQDYLSCEINFFIGQKDGLVRTASSYKKPD